MARTKPKPPKRREYLVPFEGVTVRMRAMSGRQIIALQRGEMQEGDVLEMTGGAILYPAEDLGLDDPLDLDYDQLTALLESWGNAMREKALPNANGESSA